MPIVIKKTLLACVDKAKIFNNITKNNYLNKYKNTILVHQYMLIDRNQPAAEMRIKKPHTCTCAWRIRGDGGYGVMKCDII